MATPTAEELAAGVPAGTNIVQRIPGPNGTGSYAVDEQGGVYALGGAPFLGSYWSPEMEQHRNDPNRRFTGITAESGGYRIHSSNPGEMGYFFGPQTAPTSTGPAPAAPDPTGDAAKAEAERSARATIDKLAADYGLDPGFVERMWTNWLTNNDMNLIYSEMVKDPAYKARFPGMDSLREKGRIISEAQYIAQESQIKGVMSFYSLPPGFYDDPSDYAAFISGEVSAKEIEDRVMMAAQASSQASPEVRSELQRIYGLTDGDILAFFLDPTKELEIAQKRFTAGQISGAAVASGFGGLSQAEAEGLGLGGRNLTAEQAQRGFAEVQMMEPLFSETAEEADDLGRDEQLGLAANDTTTRRQVDRRQRSRAARFEGGGGAAQMGQGRSGLG